MSTSTEGLYVPEWDLADRLTKSLRVSKLSVQDMADYLDVHRNTVSAWMNGRTPPSTQSVRLWALRTGVSYEWITTGRTTTQGPTGGGDGDGLPVPYDGGTLTGPAPNQRINPDPQVIPLFTPPDLERVAA